jgi:ElaB/YqjD/DUF883 family membrane-anchored ribosome-binding protein
MANPDGATETAEARESLDVAKMIAGAREQIGDVAERTRRAVAKADRTLITKVHENPLLVLGVAVGVGYVVGRIFSRYR